MAIDKKTLKILRFVYKKHPTLTQMEHFLVKNHLEDAFSSSIFCYIKECGVVQTGTDDEGFPLEPDKTHAFYQTNTLGNIEVENGRWFDFPYIITSIIIPIAIGIISSVSTALILMLFK